MSDPLIDKLLENSIGWLADSGPDEDIAISSRIRLARNLNGCNFPINCDDEQLETVETIVDSAMRSGLEPDWMNFKVDRLDDSDKMILFERRLASKELFSRKRGAGLWTSPDERLSLMVNEEDHLRIQSVLPGFQLEKVYETIDRFDDELSAGLDYAFDSTLGYLTCCPSNLGTGMRASVMLHLPGLVLSNQIGGVLQGVRKLNFAVRGIFGEGSDNRGNLFQVSNQSTLGESEPEIIERLSNIIGKLIDYEKRARQRLLAKQSHMVFDRVGRAYGTLRYCYMLSSEEALNSLSLIRFGVDMGMFSSMDIHMVNDLVVRINPAHLQRAYGAVEDAQARDVLRARMMRERLRG